MFADFVWCACLRKVLADFRLLAGLRRIILFVLVYRVFVVWCHLAQLHQVGNCASSVLTGSETSVCKD